VPAGRRTVADIRSMPEHFDKHKAEFLWFLHSLPVSIFWP
jgi:hypothetical protein